MTNSVHDRNAVVSESGPASLPSRLLLRGTVEASRQLCALCKKDDIPDSAIDQVQEASSLMLGQNSLDKALS